MDIIGSMFFGSLWLGFALYLLYETSAVFEYSRLLPDFITKRKRYMEIAQPHGISYSHFMRSEYDSFVVRLLTCPMCLGAWLAIAFCLTVSQPVAIPAIYFGGALAHRGFVAALNSIERMNDDERR